MRPELELHARELAWDGCLNVRDLGGHRTEDGRETRYGSVVRADSVRQLSEAGWRALVEHGIRTVVDLRGDDERQADPPADVPVDVLHVPFMEANDAEWREIEAEFDAAADAAPDDASATRDVYLIFLERFHENAVAGVRAVARAPEGGVVVHCAGGKDRTGLLTAFLLHLAGVPEEDIAADYALSEERLRPRHDAWIAAAETDAERERIRRIATTPAAAMAGVFEELRRRWGGVEEYLRAGGLTDEELELARRRLRD
ncbi:MAG: tyrosine-protein phosphatase [Actinomycetota bacterium]|nr:tyrosine-protein phosphatase [Actinomycetota bacterium]